MRFPLVFRVVILASFACGCGSYKLAPVSGQVTVNGKPLPNAAVIFQPKRSKTSTPGPGSYGKTNEQGRYSLLIVGQDRPGAVVGVHQVSISTQVSADPTGTRDDVAPPPEKLPARYNAETTLSFEVLARGTDKADFKLTAP